MSEIVETAQTVTFRLHLRYKISAMRYISSYLAFHCSFRLILFYRVMKMLVNKE